MIVSHSIVIRTDDPHTAYFINDENRQLLQCKIDESLKTELEVLYADSDFMKSNFLSWKKRQNNFVEQDNLNVEQSAYLMNKPYEFTHYSQLFTNQSEIAMRETER